MIDAQTMPVIVGTRGSKLARTQTDLVVSALRSQWPDIEIQTKIIKTEGDRKLDVSTVKLSKGAFVKEIEVALLNGEIDLAIHSCKDLPTDPVPGLTLAAFPQRADPRDTLVSREGRHLTELQPGAIIGTGSSRRKAQLLIRRPDLQVEDIRGNVETRLRKMREGQYDAVVLAAAGLDRMGWLDQAAAIFEPKVMLPAPAQGALAIQAREDDETTLARLDPLNDAATHAAVTAERAFLRALGGGCRVPIAAFARIDGGWLTLHGLVADEDGSEHVRGDLDGAIEEAAEVGGELAKQLLAEGADELLEDVSAAARAGW
ncbi:MAG: Porphobilinogen deaminase [Anaerolineales bacterium]|nr:Porphobilinogen deaminase [Anaerolineales bacterium]